MSQGILELPRWVRATGPPRCPQATQRYGRIGIPGARALNGLRVRSLSIDFMKMLESSEIQAALTTLRGKLAAYRAMKFEVARQYEEMWATVSAEKPDLVVVSPKGFPAVPMARALGTPCFSTTLQPGYVPRSDFPPPEASLPAALESRVARRWCITVARARLTKGYVAGCPPSCVRRGSISPSGRGA